MLVYVSSLLREFSRIVWLVISSRVRKDSGVGSILLSWLKVYSQQPAVRGAKQYCYGAFSSMNAVSEFTRMTGGQRSRKVTRSDYNYFCSYGNHVWIKSLNTKIKVYRKSKMKDYRETEVKVELLHGNSRLLYS